MQFEEFRLSLMPDLQTPGQWAVQVTQCPTPAMVGPKGTAAIAVSRAQLDKLRTGGPVWPNEAELIQIGTAVWSSIMSAHADAAFRACLQLVQLQNKSLRLVVSIVGDRPDQAGSGTVSPDELPIEALFDAGLRFVATNLELPLSRGVAMAPDRSAIKIAPPLRVLAIVAQPTDQPPADAAAEVLAIESALKPFIDSGAIHLEMCNPPTKERLRSLLIKGFHVVHFIGHGAFRQVGNDPTPRPHLCFEDETANRETDPVDAEQLQVLLRASGVQLVILTSCAGAAAAAAGNRYPAIALSGMAQTLAASQSGPAATVAMQFDLETNAAKTFSQAFYEGLLRNDWTLDEAVTSARAALAIKFGAGHRCTVNPVVFWRCIGGKLFEWDAFVGTGLTDADRQKLIQIQIEQDVLVKYIRDIATKPQAERDALATTAVGLRDRVNELTHERNNILGDTVRLHGGSADNGGNVQCRLTLRLRRPMRIGDVIVRISHDPSVFETMGDLHGKDLPAAEFFVQAGQAAGIKQVLARNVSAGQVMNPGEYELAVLAYRLRGPPAQPTNLIRIASAEVQCDGAKVPFQGLDAIVFAG